MKKQYGDVGEFASEKSILVILLPLLMSVNVESFSHVGTLVANAKVIHIKIGLNDEPEVICRYYWFFKV